MNRRRVVDDTPATPHFDFLYGRYHLSSWVIPYFSTIMPIRDAADSLRLATEFPGSDEVEWRLDELYQREIDWPRVERRILPYLRAPNQPQFFNSLTIALLPLGQSVSEMQNAFEDSREWRPPKLLAEGRFEKTVTVGPIKCGYWSNWTDFTQAEARTGQIRWNPEEVFAVALDGQHRLAAIQQFVKAPRIPDAQVRQTSVPVILLALDPRLGYETQDGQSLVDVLRVVFIDLNKHAKIPTRARQILLDDKDPTSVCVRALVGQTVTGDTGDLQGAPPRLPLSLVDWHTEQAKFDDGPYLTTILTLDWAIATLLGAKPVQDFMDYSAIRQQVRALSQWLKVDMSNANERLDDLERNKLRPFGYSETPERNELQQIEAAFQRVWNPVFVKLLTGFAPYEELVQSRHDEGSFSLEFENWYRLYHQQKRDIYDGRATTEYRQFLGRLPEHLGEKQLESVLADIEDSKQSLAFNVVFQRAYFLAFSDWIMVNDSHLDDLGAYNSEGIFDVEEDDAEEEEEFRAEGDDLVQQEEDTGGDDFGLTLKQRAEEYVRCLNALVQKEPSVLQGDCFFDVGQGREEYFWRGTLRIADTGNIDFTQGASSRAREVLFWVVAMQMYDERIDPENRSSFDDFWADMLDPEAPLFVRRIWRSVKRFSDRENGAGRRILAARGDEFTLEKSREEAALRMKWLWHVLEL